MLSEAVIRRSIVAYYANRFFANAMFTLGIYLLFLTRYAGFSTTQALGLFVVQFGASIAFDFAGGGLADAYGRRRAYITGMLLYIGCFLIPVIFIRNYPLLALLSVFTGVGTGLMSNTMSASIADLLDHDQARFRAVNARCQAYLFLGRAIAATAGGFMYLWYKPAPVIAEALAMMVAIATTFWIHEPAVNVSATKRRTARHLMREAFLHLQSKAPVVLRLSLAIGLIAYAAADLMFTYLQPFFAGHGYSAVQIGLITTIISLLSASGSWLAQYLQHSRWQNTVLPVIILGMAINALGYCSGLPAIIIITIFIQAVANGLVQPTQRLIANTYSPKHLRASVMSASTTITSLCMMAGFLLSGIIADHGTARQLGLLACSFILVGVCFTFRPPLDQLKTRHA
jgi:predicted MFS family arabinose efflux permease